MGVGSGVLVLVLELDTKPVVVQLKFIVVVVSQQAQRVSPEKGQHLWMVL